MNPSERTTFLRHWCNNESSVQMTNEVEKLLKCAASVNRITLVNLWDYIWLTWRTKVPAERINLVVVFTASVYISVQLVIYLKAFQRLTKERELWSKIVLSQMICENVLVYASFLCALSMTIFELDKTNWSCLSPTLYYACIPMKCLVLGVAVANQMFVLAGICDRIYALQWPIHYTTGSEFKRVAVANLVSYSLGLGTLVGLLGYHIIGTGFITNPFSSRPELIHTGAKWSHRIPRHLSSLDNVHQKDVICTMKEWVAHFCPERSPGFLWFLPFNYNMKQGWGEVFTSGMMTRGCFYLCFIINVISGTILANALVVIVFSALLIIVTVCGMAAPFKTANNYFVIIAYTLAAQQLCSSYLTAFLCSRKLRTVLMRMPVYRCVKGPKMFLLIQFGAFVLLAAILCRLALLPELEIGNAFSFVLNMTGYH